MNSIDTVYRTLGWWRINTIDNNKGLYSVVNDKTGEEHTALSYRSAHFLCDLFNNQSQWFDYRNGFTITTNSLDLNLNGPYTISNIPKANWRFYFGDSKDTFFQFYIKNPPNLIQRWLIKKLVGITWERV